jgi:hypothetical protein
MRWDGERARLGAFSELQWLAQETILFDRMRHR